MVEVSYAKSPITAFNCPFARTRDAMAIATLHKAVVFLSSLPKPQVAALLAMLSREEAAAVSSEMAAIGQVGREEEEAVLREFAAAGAFRAENGGAAEASPFAFLHGLDGHDLLTLIGDEHPQTIALVLSRLPARQAAELLAVLSPEQQASVISRIAATEQPGREVVHELAGAIRRRLSGPARAPIAKGLVKVAKMFGAMRPAAERKLLEGIAQADPDLLSKIRRAMFGADVAACAEANASSAAC
jgi:flagellar motor switch protein FliG